MAEQAEAMSDNPFIFYVLDAEQRKGPGALDLPYWVYHIRVRTTMPRYRQKELEAVRRYSDFEWFRTQLGEEYPYCILPPIPEKDFQGTFEKITSMDSLNASRLREYRQRALKNFLRRLGAHPRLRHSLLLQDFLELDESEWARRMKGDPRGGDCSITTTIGKSVNHALAGQWGTGNFSTIDSGVGYARAVEGRTNPQVWEETRLYIQQLEDSIKMLRERLQMLVDRRQNTGNVLHKFGEAFEKIGELEKGIGPTPLSTALIAVGHHSGHLSSTYIEQANDERKQVVEVLLYYTGMCAAVRETLRRVQTATSQVVLLEKKLGELCVQKERVRNKEGNAERVAKLENEISFLERRKYDAEKELKDGEEIFRDEIRRFHYDKQHDVKGFLKAFAELQLKYAARMKESWEKLRPTMEQLQADNDTGARKDVFQPGLA